MATVDVDFLAMDELHWNRVTELFDRLLAGADEASLLTAEPDEEVRRVVFRLWQHHRRADQEDYLDEPMAFEVTRVFRPGQLLLNRFRIEAFVGSGGMGEVYRAWDERLEHRVALKTIARLLAPSASIRRQFVAEVQSARRVTHPNVCRIHELFEEGETVFFAMEYLQGVLLSEHPRNDLDGNRARLVVRQLAQALHAAHCTGVVHGDFKPANVMIEAAESQSPRAVVMDFGLATGLDRAVRSSDDRLSVHGGTLEYMAPELREGRTPTVRSDIYAFGKVAALLLPRERVWEACARPVPEDRPESLEKIILRLQPHTSRRYWIAGLALAGAGTARFLIRTPEPSQFKIPVAARVLVNGFRGPASQLTSTKLARSIVLTALRQTSRIHAISDEDFLPLLQRLNTSGPPLSGPTLKRALTELRAAFWIDGDLRRTEERYSLDVSLIDVDEQRVVATSAFQDAPGVVALAQGAARWVRQAAGESR
jgi:serine/threonine protein kinase